jgi:hypothetical protein
MLIYTTSDAPAATATGSALGPHAGWSWGMHHGRWRAAVSSRHLLTLALVGSEMRRWLAPVLVLLLVLQIEEAWFTTWRLAPILKPNVVREEIGERTESLSSRDTADGGSAVAKTRGVRKTKLGSLKPVGHTVMCYFTVGVLVVAVAVTIGH